MNTDREDLRLLITEFNDGPIGSADDFAWRRHLKTYEDLLAEVKRLREAVTQYSEKDAWYVAEVKRLRKELIEYAKAYGFTSKIAREVMDLQICTCDGDGIAGSAYAGHVRKCACVEGQEE